MADYYFNQAKYIKECQYGEATEVMQCYGKCSIVKRITKAEEEKQQTPMPKTMQPDDVISSRSFFATFSPVSFTVERNYASPIAVSGTREYNNDCFHPPQTA